MGQDSAGLLVPAPELSRALATGTRAALATAAIFLVGLGAAGAQGVTDLTLLNFLGWMALVPGFWIVSSFAKLAAAAGRPSVGTSAACLFATMVVAQLYDLAELGVLPFAAEVAVWVAFALGLVVAVALPFVYEPKAAPAATAEVTAPEAAAQDGGWQSGTAPAAAGGSVASWLAKGAGFLVVLIVGVAKFGGKILGKVAVVQGVRGLAGVNMPFAELAAVLGALALLILLVVYALWFAVAKILARRQLGAVAALLGAAELLGFVLFIGGAVAAVVWLAANTEGLPVDDARVQELESQVFGGITAFSFSGAVIWSLLVVWLFASVRRRAGAPPYLADAPAA